MAEKLSERLEALAELAEPTHDAERDPSAPDAECVFVDTRPAEFEALLREAAELARSVEGAAVRNVVGQQWDDVFAREGNVVWCSDLHPGQRVRLVPEPPEVGR